MNDTGSDETRLVRLMLVPDSTGRELAISRIYQEMRRLVVLMVTAPLIGAGLFLAVSFLINERYDAVVTLVHVRGDIEQNALTGLLDQLGGVGSLAGLVLPGGSTAKDEDLALLRSRAFTDDFMQTRELLPILFADEWDSERSQWIEEDVDDQPSMADAFEFFDEDVRTISEDRLTGLVSLRIRWTDPELAADWANDIVARINEFIRKRVTAETSKNIEYLRRELEVTSAVEIEAGIYRLLESEMKTAMVASTRDQYAFRVVDPAKALPLDHQVVPNRMLMAVLGFAIGIIVAMLTVVHQALRRSRAAEATSVAVDTQ